MGKQECDSVGWYHEHEPMLGGNLRFPPYPHPLLFFIVITVRDFAGFVLQNYFGCEVIASRAICGGFYKII